jgi:hypothetical protein
MRNKRFLLLEGLASPFTLRKLSLEGFNAVIKLGHFRVAEEL